MEPRVKPEDLQRLVTVAMPYGKYKGRLIADLPGAYLAWYARKGFPPGNLGSSQSSAVAARASDSTVMLPRASPNSICLMRPSPTPFANPIDQVLSALRIGLA